MNSKDQLEAMAAEVSAKTGRSLDDCRTGIRVGMAKFLAATGGAEGLAKANSYLRDCGIPLRIRRAA